MSKNNWTDQLPELFEGYTEAAPEGLWDAVQGAMAPKQKKAAAAWWWYGAAALAAAACIAVGVFLFRNDSPVIPSDKGIIADASTVIPSEVEESVVTVPDNDMPESEEELSLTPRQDSLSSFAQPLPLPAASSQSDNLAVISSDNLSVISSEVEKSPVTVPDDDNPKSADETTVIPSDSEESVNIHQEEENDFWKEEPTTGNKNNKVKKPTEVKLKVGVASGQYLAQDVTQTTRGYGLPVAYPGMPATKAAGTTAGLNPIMLSRNKPSVTDAVHRRASRYGVTFGASIGHRWAVESGFYLTTLTSSYASESGTAKSTTEREMHYVGFPLHLQYRIWGWKGLSVYGLAGPMFETAYRTETVTVQTVGSTRNYSTDSRSIRDNRWSVQAGVGAQGEFLPGMALFIQPALSWHFQNGSDLENAYSEHPLAPELFFGLRFSF